MTGGLSFSEAFWDSDINGTYGWDTVIRRMKDGKKVCNDVIHFLKDRAKAETDYHKSLTNLSRKADGKEETGILGQGWRVLKQQTEKMATIHDEAASHYSALAEELAKFSEEQTRQKKQIEDNVKKYMQSKKNEHQKTMSMKKSYEQKCSEFNTAEETNNTLQRSVTCKKNELDKAQSKQMKCFDARQNADTAYKSAIESMESVRKKWEEEMESGCKQIEGLEISRLYELREMIWKSTNIDSVACVRHDDCCEAVRNVLEKCDINKDLQDFIENNKSGHLRPAPIVYENYYGPPVVSSSLPRNSHPTARKQTSRAPMPPPNKSGTKNDPMDDGMYASVDISAISPPSKVLMTIVRSHTAMSPSELDVNCGDVVELINYNQRHNTISVKFPNQKRIGFIPEDCAVKC